MKTLKLSGTLMNDPAFFTWGSSCFNAGPSRADVTAVG